VSLIVLVSILPHNIAFSLLVCMLNVTELSIILILLFGFFSWLQVEPYKKIRRVAFVDSIPKNASGKILRKDLIILLTLGYNALFYFCGVVWTQFK